MRRNCSPKSIPVRRQQELEVSVENMPNGNTAMQVQPTLAHRAAGLEQGRIQIRMPCCVSLRRKSQCDCRQPVIGPWLSTALMGLDLQDCKIRNVIVAEQFARNNFPGFPQR